MIKCLHLYLLLFHVLYTYLIINGFLFSLSIFSCFLMIPVFFSAFIMGTLLVASFNTNGLRTPSKRHKIFNHFRQSPYDIILLQETHITTPDIPTWSNEWKSRCYWNPGPSFHSCGVGILINTNPHLQVTAHCQDTHGRMLSITILFETTYIQLFSIYAPVIPAQRPPFFRSLSTYFCPTATHVLGGDFNLVSNPILDRTGSPPTANHTQGLPELNTLLHQFNLLDIWRFTHPSHKQYTWTSQKTNEPNIKSRLDVFFIPSTFSSQYICTDFFPTVWSDHQYITLRLPITPSIPRGGSYWKLNTDVLSEPSYRQEITALLNYCKSQIPSYNSLIPWFEFTKLHIQTTSQLYCQHRRHHQRLVISELKSQIAAFPSHLPTDPVILDSLYAQLHHLERHFTSGVFVRSREQQLLNEDQPTHFFFHQEQLLQNKKHISAVHSSDGVLQTDPSNVMRTLHDFYQDLYTPRNTSPAAQTHFLNQLTATVPPPLATTLDSPFTIAELYTVITHMASNKSPGIDGLPVEFYQVFWPQLQHEFTLLANEIFILHSSPTYTQRLAVLTLLFKDGDKTFLSNWRPISLLCTDYKILTKALTNRLQSILPHIIHPDQTCSVPGRNIFSNLYLIRDILCFSKFKRQQTYLLSLDFQKAFDTIDHNYLFKTLTQFGFGPLFIGFIRNIYSNIHSLVINNGNLSTPITVARGIRQGCPLSLPLYCIVAETIANAIRLHPRIRGVHAPGASIQLKVSQYADDTTLFTSDSSSIDTAYEVFDYYSEASSCFLNPAKTKGLFVGPSTSNPSISHDVQWMNDTGVKILGVTFFPDFQAIENFNWTKVLNKLKIILDRLRYRTLSLRGKVIILNTLALSKFWFLSSIIHIPPWAVRTLESLVFQFLWDTSGPEPIKRTTIYLPISQGGLGLLHPLYQNQALRLKYFLHIVNPSCNSPWVHYGRYWMACVLPKLNPNWTFLTANSTPKFNGTDPPLHYKQSYNILTTHITPINTMPSITTSLLYQLIRISHYTSYFITAQRDWDYIFSTPLSWPQLWPNNFTSYNVGKSQDILYKIMHKCLPTGHRLCSHMAGRGGANATCRTCSHPDETILHIFARCSFANEIWFRYSCVFKKLQPNHPFHYEAAVLSLHVLHPHTSAPLKKLLLTLTQTILYEIWIARNKKRYDRLAPNVDRSMQSIKSTLTFILKTHYTHHLKQHTLPLFCKLFCIKTALCHLAVNQLIITLPE